MCLYRVSARLLMTRCYTARLSTRRELQSSISAMIASLTITSLLSPSMCTSAHSAHMIDPVIATAATNIYIVYCTVLYVHIEYVTG
jgi:hypothetical protein